MTNVLITGGSRGIGYELVKQFAKIPNTYIVVLSRNMDKLKTLQQECETTFKNNIKIYSIDFSADNFNEAFKKIINKEAKHFHVVVNNAGVLISKPFEQNTIADFNYIYKVNLFAPACIIKEVLSGNFPSQPTHVVNISSMGGFQGSSKFAGLSVYSSSKAALANLTEVLAEEYKNTKARFNCLALGSVQTEMLNEALPGYEAQVQTEQMAEYICNFSLTGAELFNGKVIPVSLSTP